MKKYNFEIFMNEISDKFSLAEKLCLSCTLMLFQKSVVVFLFCFLNQCFDILKVEHFDVFLVIFWGGGDGSCLVKHSVF